MRIEDPTVALRAELLLLRLFAVAPLLFLAVALVIDFSSRGYFLDSISAYYGSPVRDVFVGSLVAVGIVYVIYRGNTDLEDRALDLAGFFVVILALVPHNYGEMLENLGQQSVIARSALSWILVAWIVISAIFYSIQLRWRRRLDSPFPEKSKLIEELVGLGRLRRTRFRLDDCGTALCHYPLCCGLSCDPLPHRSSAYARFRI